MTTEKASDQAQTDTTEKPWGGRFDSATDQFVEQFTASVAFDRKLARYDIQGSKAHAAMLEACGILTADENQQIQAGLDTIANEILDGLEEVGFVPYPSHF